MNLLAWNFRGARCCHFPNLIKDCVKLYNLCFLAIFEPSISDDRADRVINKLGFDGIVRVDAIGLSGGIWCLWKYNLIVMDVIFTF